MGLVNMSRKEPTLENIAIKGYFTVREIAYYLKLSESTIYGMIRANVIPYTMDKQSGNYRFDKEAIEKWLKSKRFVPNTPMSTVICGRSTPTYSLIEI